MDFYSICSCIEKHFLKSEYITIKKQSLKMLWCPKDFSFKNTHIFVFVMNRENPDSKFLKSLCDYALSVSFYDDPKNLDKVCVLPIFVSDNLETEGYAKKIGDAYILTSKICTENLKTIYSEKFPLLHKKTFIEMKNILEKIIPYNKLTEE